MFLKGYPLEAKAAPKIWNQSVHIFWARLDSFFHLGFISDPLIVSKFHNETLFVVHNMVDQGRITLQNFGQQINCKLIEISKSSQELMS